MSDKKDLSDLGKELYSKSGVEEVKKRAEELSTLGVPEFKKTGLEQQVPLGVRKFVDVNAKRKVRGRKLKFYGIIGGGVVLLVALLILVGWGWRVWSSVKDEDIGVEVVGPVSVKAGEEVVYKVKYVNGSRVDWQDVEIEMTWPSSFILLSREPALTDSGKTRVVKIGDLTAGEAGEIELKAVVIGEKDASVVTEAEIFFTPRNFPSGNFSKSFALTSTITSLSIDLALEAANEAAAGERVVATLQVRNEGDTHLRNSYIEVGASVGMQLATEDPEFSPEFSLVNSRWLLPELAPRDVVTRKLVVYLTGEPGEKRELGLIAGVVRDGQGLVQRRLAHSFELSASELMVLQTFEGEQGALVVTPEKVLDAKIEYENIGTIALTDAIVQAKFEGAGLDASRLNLTEGGNYDPVTKTITWSSASVEGLRVVQPGAKGELKYTVAISPLSDFPTEGDVLENFGLIATASIDSPDLRVPVGEEKKLASHRSVLSVETPLTLEAAAFYDDGRLGINSAGPLPPKVNQETTYTVRLRLGSDLNDVGDARVVMVLPEGVRYTDSINLTVGEVSFDERTGEVIWVVPFVEAGTGRRSPATELNVQVAIVPGADRLGDVIDFTKSITATAKDQFTETDVSIKLEGFDLPTTQTADQSKGTVVE